MYPRDVTSKSSETTVQRCSQKNVFWKYAANLQENTHTSQLYWNHTLTWVFSCIRHGCSLVNLLHTSGRLLLPSAFSFKLRIIVLNAFPNILLFVFVQLFFIILFAFRDLSRNQLKTFPTLKIPSLKKLWVGTFFNYFWMSCW